jgi:outer membrane protein assembly factor BamB
MTRMTVLALTILAVTGIGRVSAGEGPVGDIWPHWRGPHADGTAPGADPPLKWDAATNIKWKAPLPGSGSATPIVWGNQVFVVTAIRTDRVATAADLPPADPRFEVRTDAPKNFYRFEVMSFDRGTGQVRWRHTATERVPHEGHHTSHSYAAGSPTTDGKFLYVSFGSFGIYCYDLDGHLRWSRDLGRLHTRLGWGEAVTPVLRGDSLLLNWDQEADSALYCLDARTGETRWRAERDEKSSWNTPLVVEHAGRTQVIVNGTNRIRAHDLATGKALWECGGMTVNPIPSPVAANGVAYVMSGYKGAAVVAVSLDAIGDVTDGTAVRWRYGRGTPYVPSPVLVNGRLYFTQANVNLLTCLDATSGKPLIDRERLPGTGEFYASPIAAAGRLYFVDRDGTTLVLKQSDKLEVLATNRLNDAVDASPVAVGRQLFLRGAKSLYCIEEPAK